MKCIPSAIDSPLVIASYTYACLWNGWNMDKLYLVELYVISVASGVSLGCEALWITYLFSYFILSIYFCLLEFMARASSDSTPAKEDKGMLALPSMLYYLILQNHCNFGVSGNVFHNWELLPNPHAENHNTDSLVVKIEWITKMASIWP